MNILLEVNYSCAHTYNFNSSSPELKRQIFTAGATLGVTHDLLAVHIRILHSFEFHYNNMLWFYYIIMFSKNKIIFVIMQDLWGRGKFS